MADRWTVDPARAPLVGRVRVPGDKSIAHRALLFNAISRGRGRVSGLPEGRDVASTIAALRALGVEVDVSGKDCRIVGRAMRLSAPETAIDCGNSGTTMRLLCGLLSGQRFSSVLDGDSSLRRRPMERVAAPLCCMGAQLETVDGHAPIRIDGGSLRGGHFRLEVASAQVKTALLLAGMQCEGSTVVEEPHPSRDHSERMLASMGVPLRRIAGGVSLEGAAIPEATDFAVPGDPSSAAFFLCAAALVHGSELVVEEICLNSTRTGFLGVLERMGADIEVRRRRSSGGEEVGDVALRSKRLAGTEIGGGEIPATIDELPVLAVVAACAEGKTTIRDAAELRVKESDRIATTASLLRSLGAAVCEKQDGMVIEGGQLRGGVEIDSAGDHRIAMAAYVAALASSKRVTVRGAEAAAVSFPDFERTMRKIAQ